MFNWRCADLVPILFCDCCSAAKSGTTIRRSSWVAWARPALHDAPSCMNTKSPGLNRRESDKTKMEGDQRLNNIEGYTCILQWKRRLAAVVKQDGNLLSTFIVERLLRLLLKTLSFCILTCNTLLSISVKVSNVNMHIQARSQLKIWGGSSFPPLLSLPLPFPPAHLFLRSRTP